jgi:nucleotide-binding universal stress UspA family protein
MDVPRDFDDILVPTDGSKAAQRAARQAVKFARRNGATLHVLYAMDMGDASFVAVPSDIGETRKRLERKGQEFVDAVEALADEAGVPCVTAVKSNTPIEAIHEYVAEHDIDLVVMGKRGRSDPDKPLLGSITERTVGSLEVPVFTA